VPRNLNEIFLARKIDLNLSRLPEPSGTLSIQSGQVGTQVVFRSSVDVGPAAKRALDVFNAGYYSSLCLSNAFSAVGIFTDTRHMATCWPLKPLGCELAYRGS